MKGLNKLYSSMLTRVVIVTIVASEIHILVVKVVYLGHFFCGHYKYMSPDLKKNNNYTPKRLFQMKNIFENQNFSNSLPSASRSEGVTKIK